MRALVGFYAAAAFGANLCLIDGIAWNGNPSGSDAVAAGAIVSKVTPPLQSDAEYAKKAVFPSLVLIRFVLNSRGEDFWAILFESFDEGEKKINWRKQAARDLGIDCKTTFPIPRGGRIPSPPIGMGAAI